MENELKYNYIWSRDQLRAFLDHPSENVRSWAASRILQLYPDLKDAMIDILPQAPQDVAYFLLDGLLELDSNEGKVEPLLKYYQMASRPIDKNRAAILLNRYGYIFSEKDWADMPLADTTDVGSTETGFSVILKRSLETDTDETTLFEDLAFGFGSGDLYQLVASDDEFKEKRRTIKDLAKQWRCHLPDVMGMKDIPAALKLLEDVLGRNAGSPSEGTLPFPALVQELDGDLARCSLVATSLRKHLSLGNKASPNFLPILQSCSLGIARDAACRILLSRGDPGLADLWRGLTMRQWNTPAVDAQLTAYLQKQDPSMVISSLERVFDHEEGWTFAEYAFRCLEAADISGRHEMLIRALNYEWGPDAADAANDFVDKIKPDIVETALGLWKVMPPEGVPLWLRMYPTAPVVQYLVENFHEYLTGSDPRFFVELLGEIAAPQFFTLLLDEWRPGEPAMAVHIQTIADINDLEDKRLGPIIQEAEEVDEKYNSVKTDADVIKILAQKNLLVPLRCEVCKRVYSYPVECLYMGERVGDFIIGDIIQCKGCGSIEDYRMDNDALGALILQVNTLLDLCEAGELSKEDLPIKGKIKGIMAGGVQFSSVVEAYQFTGHMVEEEPENTDLRVGLAMILSSGNRWDLALPHYLEAFRLDPNNSDAAEGIALTFIKQKKYMEAVPYLEKLPVLLRRGKMGDDERRNLFLSLTNMADTMQKESGYRLQVVPLDELGGRSQTGQTPAAPFNLDSAESDEFEKAYQRFMGGVHPPDDNDLPFPVETGAEPVVNSSQKVGRNDPCPCGSGKKYKKCCGR